MEGQPIVHIGSMNPTKIQATKNILGNIPSFGSAEFIGIEVAVEEFGHPKSLQETIDGAKARAEMAFEGSSLSVGIESGLFEASGTATGYLETTACALFDGSRFAIGMSPSFEWPPKMTELILGGLDGSQAFKKMGLTEHEKIGNAEGAIHFLTHGKLNRTNLNELAIMMAILQFENPQMYQ